MKKEIVSLGIASILFAVVGCGHKEEHKAVHLQKQSVLRCELSANVVTLDPVMMSDYPTFRVLSQVFGGLVALDQNNQLVPNIAEKWSISDDRKTYTFRLKSGMKFSNGREVTSEDVKWSFDRACNPKLASPTADGYLNDIVGCDESLKGKAKGLSGVKVTDPKTIKITIKNPSPYFVSKLAFMVAAILPKGSVSFDQPISKIAEMVGTGPFKVKKYINDQIIELEPNEYYYPGKPKLSHLEFQVIKDPMTRITAYKAGKLDLIEVPSIEITNIKEDPLYKKQLYHCPSAATYWFEFNSKMYKPFENIRVRQAFAMAIDRKSIVENVLQNNVDMAFSILPPGIPGRQDKVNNFTYDVLAARRYLAEAGYENASKLPPLKLTVTSRYPVGKNTSEAAVIQLRKVFPGLKVSLETLAWDTYLKKLDQKEIAFRFAGWIAGYIDPANFLSDLFVSTSSMNYIHFSNPEFDKLCHEADHLPHPERRWPLYANAENILLQDAIIIPLFYSKDYYLIRENVKGVETNLQGFLPFGKVDVE